MNNFDEKVFSIKEKREIGLLTKRSAFNSAEEAELERLFNNRYLFGYDGDIGVLDLISLYFTELNLFSGSTTNKPDLINTTSYSDWHNKFKRAVRTQGDGDGNDSFYREDATLLGGIAEDFLNDGGTYEGRNESNVVTPGTDWFFNNGFSLSNSNYFIRLEDLDYEAGEEALTPIDVTNQISPTITLETGVGYVSHSTPADNSWYETSAEAEADAQTIIAATKNNRALLGKRTNRETYFIEEDTYEETQTLCPGDDDYVDPGDGSCYESDPISTTVYRFVIEEEITYPDVYSETDRSIILGIINAIRDDLEEYRNYLRDDLKPEVDKILNEENDIFTDSKMTADVYNDDIQIIIDNIGDKTDTDATDPEDTSFSFQSRLNFFRSYFSLLNKEVDIDISNITDPSGDLLGDYFLFYNDNGTYYIWFGEDGNQRLDPGATASSLEVSSGTSENDLDGKYFLLNSTTSSYYIWFNDTSDETPSSDPAPSGIDFGIHVNMNASGTIPELIATAISAEEDFFAEVDDTDNTFVNIYNTSSGVVSTHIEDGNINADPNFYINFNNQSIRSGLNDTPVRIDLENTDDLDILGNKIQSIFDVFLVDTAIYSSNVVSLDYYLGEYINPVDGAVGYETGFTFTETVVGQVYDRDEFNDYLNNVNSENQTSLVEIETEITSFFNNRITEVTNNVLSNNATNAEGKPDGIRKWLHFWISEQIKKFQSPYMSLVGLNASFKNAEKEISSAEQTIDVLLSDIPLSERAFEYFNEPDLLAAYLNPVLNEETGEIVQQRIGIAWIGTPSANNYKIYIKEINRLDPLTNDNWTSFDEEVWIDDYNEDSKMLKTEFTKEVDEGVLFAFRAQSFDIDDTGDFSDAPGFDIFNKPILTSSQFDFFGGSILSNVGRLGSFNSGSKQSPLLGETFFFESIVDGVVNMGEEHEFNIGQFIYMNDRLYKILETTEQTFTIEESLNITSGSFQITKGIIET